MTGRAKKWKTRGGGGDDEVMKLVGRKSYPRCVFIARYRGFSL